MKWEPIETAPKDGTEVIVYRSDWGCGVCAWYGWEDLVPTNEVGDPIEEYDEDYFGWYSYQYGWVEDSGPLTHWMPLPEPPETET